MTFYDEYWNASGELIRTAAFYVHNVKLRTSEQLWTGSNRLLKTCFLMFYVPDVLHFKGSV